MPAKVEWHIHYKKGDADILIATNQEPDHPSIAKIKEGLEEDDWYLDSQIDMHNAVRLSPKRRRK